MKAQLPEGSRADRIAFMRRWIRQRRADEPGVRLSRARRRVIVAGLYLLLLATLSALAGGPGSMPSVLGVTPVAYLTWLFTGQVICFLLLNYSVRGLLAADEYVDERERELRDRATTVAYRLLTGVLAVLSFYVLVSLLFKVGLPIPSTAWQLLLLLIPLGWLASSLPQSVLAWTLPDAETHL
jgi:hypothetical protein